MKEETIDYSSSGTSFSGHLVFDDTSDAKRPAVLVAHAWKGQDHFAKEKARFLAQKGYVGFAIDMYGEGKRAHSNEEALALMTPLFCNRQDLRNRVVAAYHCLANHPLVDQGKIGAIGFCFGGLVAIELLQSGAAVRGVVSFHGLLGNTLGDKKADVVPAAEKIEASLLLLHGHLDPLSTQEDVWAIQERLTKQGIEWQMNIYGQAMHSFSNPDADDKESGLLYDKKSEARALVAMTNFFKELFNPSCV